MMLQTVAAMFHKKALSIQIAVVLGHDWFSICACYLAKFYDDKTNASIRCVHCLSVNQPAVLFSYSKSAPATAKRIQRE